MQVFSGQHKKQTSLPRELRWKGTGYLRETTLKDKSGAVSCVYADG